MSRFLDLARQAEFGRLQRQRAAAGVTRPDGWNVPNRPFRVITVAGNKGGIGKTTIASNLAVYLRVLRPDLPVLLFGLDDSSSLDRAISFDPDADSPTIADSIRSGSLRGAIRLGRHGVRFVGSSEDLADLKREVVEPFCLQRVLLGTEWHGLVVIDTKSDFESLTLNALAASDLVLLPVSDRASLHEARRVYRQLETWQRPRKQARIVLSLVDLRVRFADTSAHDMLSLLVSEIRRAEYPMFETFLSRSPKIESLQTNPTGRTFTILKGAHGSLMHRQMRRLADEVLTALRREDAPESQKFAPGRNVRRARSAAPQPTALSPDRPTRLTQTPATS